MRLLGQSLFAASVLGLSLMVAPACVDNDQSIYIKQVMAPPTSRTGGACSYTADPSQPALFEGAVDFTLTKSYSAVVLVGNQMIQRTDNLSVRAESNKAHINGAIVRLTDANGGDIAEFTAQASGFADAANGNVASFGLMAVTLIDPPNMAKVSAGIAPLESKLILAQIKVFGETLGGVDLESGEFQFGIRVTNGGLVSFAGADDPLTPGVDCNAATSATGGGSTTTTNAPCIIGQDESVPCTLCKDVAASCRTPGGQ